MSHSPLNKKTQALSLLHTELDLNLEEQKILKKRIDEVENFLKGFSKEDPSYGLYESQLYGDKIYFDELVLEEEGLRVKIELEASKY